MLKKKGHGGLVGACAGGTPGLSRNKMNMNGVQYVCMDVLEVTVSESMTHCPVTWVRCWLTNGTFCLLTFVTTEKWQIRKNNKCFSHIVTTGTANLTILPSSNRKTFNLKQISCISTPPWLSQETITCTNVDQSNSLTADIIPIPPVYFTHRSCWELFPLAPVAAAVLMLYRKMIILTYLISIKGLF